MRAAVLLPPPPSPVLHTCACGRSHTADEWAELRSPGLWDFGDDVLDLRDCECGSTMAISIGVAS